MTSKAKKTKAIRKWKDKPNKANLKENEKFNWTKKAEIAGKNSGYPFEEYGGNFDEFLEEVQVFFRDPRVFTYTPLIACRGRKPFDR